MDCGDHALHYRKQLLYCGEQLLYYGEEFEDCVGISVVLQGTSFVPRGATFALWTTTFYYGEEFVDCGEHPLYYKELLYYGEQLLHYGEQLLYYGEDFLNCGEHPMYYREQLCTKENDFCIMENKFCIAGKNLWIVRNIRCTAGNSFCIKTTFAPWRTFFVLQGRIYGL